MTRTVWGYVYEEGTPRAAYFIRWTEGHPERGAQIAISIGEWGTDAEAPERLCIGLTCQMGADRPSFVVVDAAHLPWGGDPLLGKKLSREAALGDSICEEAFAIADRIVEDDPRVRAFLLARD